MLRLKRRSSPPFSGLPAELQAARCCSLASCICLAYAQADGDKGRGKHYQVSQHHGHQLRSTDAICGDTAEPRRPLGVAGRRGSRNGLTNRCKQSTFMTAAAAPWSRVSFGVIHHPQQPSSTLVCRATSLPERQPG